MNLSEHFTREEFEHSDTANAYKIKNVMNEAQVKMAIHTCQYLLEPIRALMKEKYGKVYIQITSGFRGAALNAKVKGASTSQHCKAQAADIFVFKVSSDGKKAQIPPSEVYNEIKAWVKAGKLTIDQCIDEHTKTASWTHVSLADQLSKCRKQFLKYNGKSYSLDK